MTVLSVEGGALASRMLDISPFMGDEILDIQQQDSTTTLSTEEEGPLIGTVIYYNCQQCLGRAQFLKMRV